MRNRYIAREAQQVVIPSLTMSRIHTADISRLRVRELCLSCDGIKQKRFSYSPIRNIRFSYYYDYKSFLSSSQSFDRLTAAFGESSVSYATVKNGFAEFRRGRTSLDDEERCGRPSEAVTEDNVELVRAMTHADSRVSRDD